MLEPTQDQKPASVQRAADMRVFSWLGNANFQTSQTPAVIGVRATISQIEPRILQLPSPKDSLMSALESSYPSGVASGPDSIGYVWRLVDGEWQIVCLSDELILVDHGGEQVAIQLHLEMSL